MTAVSRAELLRGRFTARDAAVEPASGPVKAEIGSACLSVLGVECRVCGEHCEAGAIRFRPLGRGRWFPDVALETCTGCGDCAAPCPVGAVAMRPFDDQKEIAACG